MYRKDDLASRAKNHVIILAAVFSYVSFKNDVWWFQNKPIR